MIGFFQVGILYLDMRLDEYGIEMTVTVTILHRYTIIGFVKFNSVKFISI